MDLSGQLCCISHKGLKACIKYFKVLDQDLGDLIDPNKRCSFFQRKSLRLSEVGKIWYPHRELRLYDLGFRLTPSATKCSRAVMIVKLEEDL